jgi:hypothetical protein
MTTADYALFVSIGSAAISLFSLGWSVWAKFIYPKGRLRMSFETCVVTLGARPPWPSFVALTCTNHGPAEIPIRSALIVISTGRLKRGQFALVNPIHNLLTPDVGVGPFAGGLPKTLKVGEGHTAYFPHTAHSFARDDLLKVGFNDAFGRFHGASRKDIRKVKAELDKAFFDQPYTRQPDDDEVE